MSDRRLLVTSALPYANGPIHLGHMVEYIQTDIWVRFQRMAGHECIFVCASDAHGTPIMIKARQEGIAPEDLIARFREEHQADFAGFRVVFDNFHTTHSEENRELVETIYDRIREAGHLETRSVRQAYDEEEGMFLPDRFVRGTCPRCGAPDQYGDSCEACGATYAPSELVDPVSVLSGTPPVQRDSEHLFFRLGDFNDSLRQWVASGSLQPAVTRKLEEWFEAGLQDWDISRDAPYFGFEIPDMPGKYFYVWLDAPVGYMASFVHLARRREGLDFEDFFGPGSEAELYHFIGKDIVYFHSLFWPAVLEAAGYRRPTAVYAHGFLTVDGEKMSKSRGTFIRARAYLDHLDPEYLRYYYAAKLGPGVEDIDLSLEDFVQKVNSDLVGKVVNIASRCAKFINSMFDGRLAERLPEPALARAITDAADGIARDYEGRNFARAMREVMALADRANQYIDQHKPWAMAKEGGREEEIQAVCTQGLDAFRRLVILLKPVLPALAEAAEAFLGERDLAWSDLDADLVARRVEPFKPLMSRVDPKRVQAMVEASRESLSSRDLAGGGAQESLPAIDIESFREVELRVARVAAAHAVEGADKLLRLDLDLGDLGRRQVLAGIAEAYRPRDLVGRLVIAVANLEPRKMRFGVSEGMILAAGPGGDRVFLLSPDEGAEPGMRVT